MVAKVEVVTAGRGKWTVMIEGTLWREDEQAGCGAVMVRDAAGITKTLSRGASLWLGARVSVSRLKGPSSKSLWLLREEYPSGTAQLFMSPADR